MFSEGKQTLIDKIEDLKALVSDLEKVNDKKFVENSINIEKKRIDDLERTVMALNLMENKKLKDKNDKLRKKAIKRNDTIKIKTITKDENTYAIVPIEILPKYLEF